MAQKTPPTSEQLAAQLAALYVIAEQNLLSGAATILRTTVPDLAGQQRAVGRFRRLVQRILAALDARTSALVVAMVNAAGSEGRRDADRIVGQALERIASLDRSTPPPTPPPGSGLTTPDGEPFDLSAWHADRAAQAIRDDLVSALDDVRRRLTRYPDDIYKAIAPHGAIYQVSDNDVTPQQAQAMAWRVFVSQGVRGFTDRSGREWTLSAYTEMAVRTAATRAYNTSHLARMKALGVEYFSVPNTGHPCPLCFPWQFRILTDGPIADPVIPVDATIAEAVAAGLFHPNCRHVLLPVFPGYTVLPDPEVWTDEHARLYRLSQTQRRLELAVRKAKRRFEYALTPEQRGEALADIRRAQRRLREFVRVTGFLRDTRREQVDLSDAYIKLPAPIR